MMDDLDGPEQEAHPLGPEDEDPGIAAWRERCRTFGTK